MKLIINISDESYDKALNGIIKCKECFDAIVYGTPIPDNATNGENVIKIFCKGIVRISSRKNVSVEFNKNWWNAPYKAESEE